MKTSAAVSTLRGPAVASAPSGAAVPVGEHPADLRTRDAVIRQLLAGGELTALAIAERLGLSPAGIRRHLDALIDAGTVAFRARRPQARAGRGRPARHYLLTEAGRSNLPHAYDELAVHALEYLDETGGPAAVADFARRRAEAVLAPFRTQLAAAQDIPAKADVLATALTSAGFSASVERVGVGAQLCQHHCPVGHVAARFPQLCEAEMDAFTDALGTYAQRLATLTHGATACTTFIPAAAVTVGVPEHHHVSPDKSRLSSGTARLSSDNGRTTS